MEGLSRCEHLRDDRRDFYGVLFHSAGIRLICLGCFSASDAGALKLSQIEEIIGLLCQDSPQSLHQEVVQEGESNIRRHFLMQLRFLEKSRLHWAETSTPLGKLLQRYLEKIDENNATLAPIAIPADGEFEGLNCTAEIQSDPPAYFIYFSSCSNPRILSLLTVGSLAEYIQTEMEVREPITEILVNGIRLDGTSDRDQPLWELIDGRQSPTIYFRVG